MPFSTFLLSPCPFQSASLPSLPDITYVPLHVIGLHTDTSLSPASLSKRHDRLGTMSIPNKDAPTDRQPTSASSDAPTQRVDAMSRRDAHDIHRPDTSRPSSDILQGEYFALSDSLSSHPPDPTILIRPSLVLLIATISQTSPIVPTCVRLRFLRRDLFQHHSRRLAAVKHHCLLRIHSFLASDISPDLLLRGCREVTTTASSRAVRSTHPLHRMRRVYTSHIIAQQPLQAMRAALQPTVVIPT